MKRSKSTNMWGSILKGNPTYDVIIGIDPGVRGAMAIFHQKALSLHLLPIKNKNEVCPASLQKIAIPAGKVAVCCEDVLTIPGMKAQNMRLVGQNFGVLKTWAEMREFHWVAIRPLVWQNALGLTTSQSRIAVEGGPKARAQFMANSLFPETDFHAPTPKGTRSRVPHDGYIDAALIGYFAKSFIV